MRAILFFIFLAPAFAKILLVKPFYAELSNGSELKINQVQPNETLKLYFKKTVNSITWDSATCFPNACKVEDSNRFFLISVKVPEKASYIKIKFVDSETELANFFSLHLQPKDSLIYAQLENTEANANFLSNAKFSVIVSNASLAEHCIVIKSSLPKQEFEPKIFCIAPQSTKKFELCVHAYAPYSKTFYFYIDSNFFPKRYASLKATINVKQTLFAKLLMPLYAFPLNIQLFHSYVFNALLSLI